MSFCGGSRGVRRMEALLRAHRLDVSASRGRMQARVRVRETRVRAGKTR